MAKIKYDFNPFKLTGESATKIEDKAELMQRIAKLVTDTVTDNAASQRSAVSKRGKWQKLSKDYAAAQKGGNRTANLRLTSDMLDSLDTDVLKGNTLRTTVGDDEQKKADGHNNFSGKSELPTRRFIPNVKDGETWNSKLIKRMAELIREHKKE